MGSLFKLSLQIRQAVNAAVVFTRRIPKPVAQATPGEYLLGVRAKLGLTQAEAADRAGISQQQIQLLESGKVDARLETWRRVFNALHCDLLILPKPRRQLGDAKAERVLG